MKENEDAEKNNFVKKPVMFLGRDLSQIACFRSSFLFGICSGIAGGLICFMATSKPRLSSHVAFGSTWVAVLAYWIPCRYKHETNILIREKAKMQMNKKFAEQTLDKT